MTATQAFDQCIRDDSELRRVYLMMLVERRAALVASAFTSAKTFEQIEHARGGVAVLDALTTSYNKENVNASRRQDYTDRAGDSA